MSKHIVRCAWHRTRTLKNMQCLELDGWTMYMEKSSLNGNILSKYRKQLQEIRGWSTTVYKTCQTEILDSPLANPSDCKRLMQSCIWPEMSHYSHTSCHPGRSRRLVLEADTAAVQGPWPWPWPWPWPSSGPLLRLGIAVLVAYFEYRNCTHKHGPISIPKEKGIILTSWRVQEKCKSGWRLQSFRCSWGK